MSQPQQQYVNPVQIATKNPAMFYPDGVFDSFVSPQLGLSWRPEGAAFRPSSDARQTVVPEVLKSPGARRRGKGFGIRPNYPDLPLSPQAPVAVHDPTPGGDTSDPRTERSMQVPAELNVQPSLWDRVLGGWAASPVGMLFLAFGFVVLLNQLVFRGGLGAGRGAARAGAGLAGVGQAAAGGAASTGRAGSSALQKAVGGAVEAVEDIGK